MVGWLATVCLSTLWESLAGWSRAQHSLKPAPSDGGQACWREILGQACSKNSSKLSTTTGQGTTLKFLLHQVEGFASDYYTMQQEGEADTSLLPLACTCQSQESDGDMSQLHLTGHLCATVCRVSITLKNHTVLLPQCHPACLVFLYLRCSHQSTDGRTPIDLTSEKSLNEFSGVVQAFGPGKSLLARRKEGGGFESTGLVEHLHEKGYQVRGAAVALMVLLYSCAVRSMMLWCGVRGGGEGLCHADP